MAKRSTSSGYEDAKGGKNASELRGLIIEILARATDTVEALWVDKIGSIEVMPIWSNIRSNWTVAGTGEAYQVRTIESAAELVREQHPYARV